MLTLRVAFRHLWGKLWGQPGCITPCISFFSSSNRPRGYVKILHPTYRAEKLRPTEGRGLARIPQLVTLRPGMTPQQSMCSEPPLRASWDRDSKFSGFMSQCSISLGGSPGPIQGGPQWVGWATMTLSAGPQRSASTELAV